VRAVGTGSRLLVSQVRRDGRQRTIRGNRDIFSMSTKRAAEPDEPEYPVTGREKCDTVADRLDFPGKLVPRTVPRGLTSPVKNLEKKGLPERKPQSVRFTVVA
jgi:hypothetical protein